MANNLNYKNTRFGVGDIVRVHQIIKEGEKSRVQVFEGVLIAVSNRESGQSFTVRKIAANSVGVERIFPVNSPFIEKIELKQAGQVKRAKLFYLRNRVGKAASAIKKKVLKAKQV